MTRAQNLDLGYGVWLISQALEMEPAAGFKRGWSTAQGGVAYGCTFRPDQVHNFPLRGSPPDPLPRAAM